MCERGLVSVCLFCVLVTKPSRTSGVLVSVPTHAANVRFVPSVRGPTRLLPLQLLVADSVSSADCLLDCYSSLWFMTLGIFHWDAELL